MVPVCFLVQTATQSWPTAQNSSLLGSQAPLAERFFLIRLVGKPVSFPKWVQWVYLTAVPEHPSELKDTRKSPHEVYNLHAEKSAPSLSFGHQEGITRKWFFIVFFFLLFLSFEDWVTVRRAVSIASWNIQCKNSVVTSQTMEEGLEAPLYPCHSLIYPYREMAR